ncbi:hypothetical protein M441DRAFT_450904 [Trichoderma asperellum CBS 433.97]|uniref:Uncharacterized protein n=1 Tax=Trichoderma asperellum (strain ATCC 204424 / CBS 433.97 / NBRC 101777) TaxID=1042311 RepID=A0A2T3ZJK3_TRIA4|nr:hypothetical protein M441DRAFT_450904 [Trichoderma asperellum CBS 433.97]PTB44987.1 hypothetical protein M441DRAFT_450904 [Trichoderma asperellum CBS 433.97]
MPAIGSSGLFSRQRKKGKKEIKDRDQLQDRAHWPGTGYMRIYGSLPALTGYCPKYPVRALAC